MPDRIQLSRAAGWRKPEGAIVVARPSIWGNPWRPGSPGTFWLPDYPVANHPVGCSRGAEDAVALYRHLLTGGPDPHPALPATLSAEGLRHTRELLRQHATRVLVRLPELRGRDLACWCPAGCPCHADVLLELANA